MESVKLQITSEQLLSLFRQFSKEEQLRIFEQLKKIVKKPNAGEGAVSKELVYQVPDLPIENFNEPIDFRKYALKEKDLEPLIELFKDAPPVEELIKLLKENE